MYLDIKDRKKLTKDEEAKPYAKYYYMEMKRPDGGKDRIYYSITTEEEENERRKEESKKLDKSMEMLDNMIIFEKGGIKR